MSKPENAGATETTTRPGAGHGPGAGPGLPTIDVNEYGGKKDGVRQQMNERLFMQLLVVDVPNHIKPSDVQKALSGQLRERNVPGVVYADTMSPRGIGLLTWGRDPAVFVDAIRPMFETALLSECVLRPEFGMIGRTYSIGYEPDLAHVLLQRPVDNVLNPALGWHVWYPLRRSGAFARLAAEEESALMREHAAIGMAYGQAGLGHDVRLACHGLDASDNEFVIGLVGKELHPLSHLVQAMRKTRQTSEFITQMGPFFIGRVLDRVSAS